MQTCARAKLARPEVEWSARELRAGEPVAAEIFERIRRRMMLDFCKWDPQVGDVGTLASFPLFIGRRTWELLARLAEEATAELLEAEAELLGRPELHRALGLPWAIRSVLRNGRGASPAAVRVMRFDFHLTTEGWRISEVNSDVPGGFTEASSFTAMMAEQCACQAAGNPAAVWADAVAKAGRSAALLYAPGYLEDMQIMAYLRDRLAERGVAAVLAKPQQLRFVDGRAHLEEAGGVRQVEAVVRFFQAEWLPRIGRRRQWAPLFVDGLTPIANPATAILTESKRLALVMHELRVSTPTWRSLLPETRAVGDAPWQTSSDWILKTALCNTGDTVCMPGQLTPRQWRKTRWDVLLNPRQWIAQRRFEAVSIETLAGPVYPCLGVYTIDGKAAGIYGRFATKPLIDFAAVDAAVLIEEEV
jgi:hypothetical protein